jgi:YD repeat-containing protein
MMPCHTTSHTSNQSLVRLLGLLALLFFFPETFAQQSGDPFRINLIPPSPEAAALAKYADIPISLYSGTPQIAIPLYELQERELTLPIALSYHASGHKVETLASRVGMGWVLEAGGVITRTIMGGWPDEFSTGGFYHQQEQHGIADFALGNQPADQQFAWYDAMANGCMDIEPDIFYFNFGGYTGKFMFNWDGQIEIASGSDLKIQPIGMNPGTDDFIDGWKVIAEDGTVFTFDVIETTDITSSSIEPSYGCELGLNDRDIPLSWYLREISSPDQQTWIRFEYEPYNQSTESWSLETQMHDDQLGVATPKKQRLTLDVHGKQLKQITTSSGQTTINFLNGAQRTDVAGMAYALGEMIVKNNRSRIIKDWKFDYDYSTNRLTLKKITEWSGLFSNPPYQFSYTGGLPETTSYARDHWGFYNSNTVNTMIRATTAYRVGATLNPVELPGANREPSPNLVLAGLLREIIYPAGGKDLLQFESHDYSFEQSSELIKEIVIPRQYEESAPDWGTPDGETDINEVSFTLPYEVDEITVDASFTYGMTFGSSAFPVKVIVKNKTTGEELMHLSPGGTAHQENGEVIPENKAITTILRDVPPGLYALIVSARAGIGNNGDNSGGAILNYEEPTGQYYTEIKSGGGARIARMTRSFGNGSPDKITRYTYRIFEDGREKSSGSLLESGYRYEEWMQYQEPVSNPFLFDLVNRFFRFSQNKCALGTTQGSHVGYSSVTVLQGENGENGKTVYTYTSPREVQDYNTFELPYPPAESYDYQRGWLLQQKEYDFSGLLLKETLHEYTGHKKEVLALKVGWRLPGAGPVGEDFLNRYALGNYANILGYNRLKTTLEKIYHPGNTIFENSQQFRYNENNGHKQLTLIAAKNSENDSVFTQMTYPQDYADGTSGALDVMKSNHIVNQIVEKLSWQKTPSAQISLLSALKTDFRILSGETRPQSLKGARISVPVVTTNPRATAASLYEERLQYINYDDYRNLTEHALKDGTRISYVWGENGTVPIAKADHATATQIFHTSFEEDTQATTLYQRTGNKSKAMNGGAYALPVSSVPALAGNYILSYWTKNGTSAWVYREKNIQNYQPGNTMATDPVTGYLDEVRVYPQGAAMTTYTYEPLVGITSITDTNNVTVYFEYDGFNRLQCKRDQDRNILECYDYQYQEEVQYAVQN